MPRIAVTLSLLLLLTACQTVGLSGSASLPSASTGLTAQSRSQGPQPLTALPWSKQTQALIQAVDPEIDAPELRGQEGCITQSFQGNIFRPTAIYSKPWIKTNPASKQSWLTMAIPPQPIPSRSGETPWANKHSGRTYKVPPIRGAFPLWNMPNSKMARAGSTIAVLLTKSTSIINGPWNPGKANCPLITRAKRPLGPGWDGPAIFYMM